MTMNKIVQFRSIAPDLFDNLRSDHGYNLIETKVNQRNDGMDWSIQLIYVNDDKQLKIVIKQEPYYTDYGFSFFI